MLSTQSHDPSHGSQRAAAMTNRLLIFLLCLCAPLAARAADCNTAAPSAVTFVQVPGEPFTAIPSRDGCRIFVSLKSSTATAGPGLAVFSRRQGDIALERTAPLRGIPLGMSLTHDGQMLVVASGSNVAFVDVRRLTSGDANPVVANWSGQGPLLRAYVDVSADDHYLFVSDEILGVISIIDLAQARASGFTGRSQIHSIRVGGDPVGLALSSDQRYLFVTSQSMEGLGWPRRCQEPGNADAASEHAEGAIVVIDVQLALSNPSAAVVKVAKAGCNPVRVVTSTTGVYVTARASNSLLVFNERQLLARGTEALPAYVPVGKSPIGVHVVDNGRKVVVANSDRFVGTGIGTESISVIDTAKVGAGKVSILGSIPTHAFPREIRSTADGRTLLVTNFSARMLEIVDLTRNPWSAAAQAQSRLGIRTAQASAAPAGARGARRSRVS